MAEEKLPMFGGVTPIEKILVIADDLTGANDTGLQFAREGLKTSVMLRLGEPLPLSTKSVVEVVNTDSRSLAPDHAYQSMGVTLGKLELSHCDLIYKKIDSTLRGSIGAEIDALLDTYPFDFVVVAPAYPAHGRYTIGGYHLVHEKLLEDSEVARDPRTPVRESLIPSILAKQTGRPIGHIAIDRIRSTGLSKAIKSLLRTKHQILVFDSVASGDLEAIANELLAYQQEILWVGSAGLAQAIAKNLTKNSLRMDLDRNHAMNSSNPVLVVAGSLNKATQEQVETLLKGGRAQVLAVPACVLLGNDELDPYIREAGSRLSAKHNLVIMPERQGEDLAVSTDGCDVSLRIVSRLGELARQVIVSYPLAGVVLTGGDTALETCKQLGIQELQIIGEVAEGIPITLAAGRGLYKGPIVTKAGGFGQADSLLGAIQRLRKEEKPDA